MVTTPKQSRWNPSCKTISVKFDWNEKSTERGKDRIPLAKVDKIFSCLCLVYDSTISQLNKHHRVFSKLGHISKLAVCGI